MKTSLLSRIVCLAAAILVTFGGVMALAGYALPPAQAAQLAAASRAAALLAADAESALPKGAIERAASARSGTDRL